jgi:hypothetical protein
MTGILYAIVSTLIKVLLSKWYLKCFGVLLLMFITLFCWYAVLIIAALMGEEKANKWAIEYAVALGTDMFVS